MKTHRTSLSKNYVSDWTVADALRELFQNAIDHGAWGYGRGPTSLSIVSHEADLEPYTLLLGQSQKKAGAVGKFGEGYKLASLVLIREGLSLKIVRPHDRGSWQPRLSKSRTYNTEQLVFDERPFDNATGNLYFEVGGLNEEHWRELERTNLHINRPQVLFTVNENEVLSDRPGQVYVRGLWVTEIKELRYGYNFTPDIVSLDRDRRMVREFDVFWATSKLWLKGQHSDTSDLVLQGVDDVKFLASHLGWIESDNTVADGVATKFIEEHTDKAVAVSSRFELDDALKQGHEKVVLVASAAADVLRQSSLYVPPPPPKPRLTPHDKMEAFYDKHKDILINEDLAEEFTILLEASKNWRELS